MNLETKRQEVENQWNELMEKKKQYSSTINQLQNEIETIDQELLMLKGRYEALTELIEEDKKTEQVVVEAVEVVEESKE